MFPSKFYKPWSEIDPQLRAGGIPGELEQFFVGPDVGDNPTTMNSDLHSLFALFGGVVRSISMAPSAMREGAPDRRIVEEVLQGINFGLERIVDITHTDATRFFAFTHAIPPNQKFAIPPVRFPLRQEFANSAVMRFLGTLVEIAEANANANHAGLDPRSSEVIIAPLYDLKASIIKFYFDLEVSGEISMMELNMLFEGRFRVGPTVSYPDASSDRPDAAATTDALSGVDVMQWAPTQEDWAVFAKLSAARYVPERIYQPEGSLPTTEDVAYEQPIANDGSVLIPGQQP